MFLSPQQFADYAHRMHEIREASYVPGRTYGKSWSEAAEEALVPKEWHWPIVMFVFDGYAETDEWIEQHRSKK